MGGGWQIRVGKDIIDEINGEEMSERTDWGGLLKPDEIKLPEPSETVEDRGKWRSPDL